MHDACWRGMSSALRVARGRELASALVVDKAVSSRVRVRSWRRADPTPVSGRPAAHDGVEVAWFASGTAEYRVGRHTLQVGEGDAVVVPSQTEHTTAFLTEMRAGAVWLSPEFVDEVADAFGANGQDLGASRLGPEARLFGLGRELEAEVAEAGPGQIVAIESLAEALVVRLLRVAGSDGRAPVRDRRMRAALELVEARFADPLDVDDLARAAGMSRFHFSRAFRDATGKAPYAYLLDVRLARAAELLRGGQRSVTEVAFEVGFRDLGRFARAFRAKTGRSPNEWRRS